MSAIGARAGSLRSPSYPRAQARGARAVPKAGRQRGLPLLAKHAVDRTLALVGLVVLSPLLLCIALLIRVRMGAPIFFTQARPGLHGKPFRIVKFRTMAVGDGPDDRRLTPVGARLRAFSLDELPQLWNVLRGELSLVGPRPLLMQYLSRYTPEQARRHEVMPGITGWTQVNGRNALTWKKKFALDLWYVDHWSLGLDLAILARTAVSVLARDGISREGHATMPEFMGDERDEA